MAELGTGERHRIHEDVAAVLLGSTIVSLALVFYAQATLVTSGVAGLALLLHHATGVSVGLLFFAINLPFFVLSALRLGAMATLRTVCAIAVVSALTRLTPLWLGIVRIDALYAAIVGGMLAGLGVLALFRHRTGLGGTNILAMYLQERHGMRAGYVLLAFDAAILAASAFVLDPGQLLLSLLGATILNGIVAMNHKPGRYTAMS